MTPPPAARGRRSQAGRAREHRLQELDRAKDEFVSNVSHELRTPLTSISGYLEMLADGDAGELNHAQARMVAVADRNTDRLMALIEDLLALSRIEADAFKIADEPVDVAELLAGVEAAVRPSAHERRLDLVVEAPDERLWIRGDARQLDRALLNLLSNAVKFTLDGGRVELRAAERDGRMRIAVSDTGIGIPEEDQSKLFTRFFRSSNAVDQAVPGTGLGLVIVKSIVERHAGAIEVSSRPGEGTTVELDLPLAAAPAEASLV